MNPVPERVGCWYCGEDFKTMTDAWRHMDDEHPEESAADLSRMNADNVRRLNAEG